MSLGEHDLPYEQEVAIKDLPSYIRSMFKAVMDYFGTIQSEVKANEGGSCLVYDSMPALIEGMRGRGLLIRGTPDTCFDVHHDASGNLTTTQRY